MVKVLIIIIVVLSILLIISIGVIIALLKSLDNSNQQLRWYNMRH